VIENHMRAERTILGARRGWVDCANVSIDGWPGIHCPKRPTDRCRITTARSDQESAVHQPEHKAVGCPVAIKIGPEDYVSRCINCLHWIARVRQTKALSAIDRIEEHDHFAPISRSSRKPTRINSIWSRMIIGKEGNLSGAID
jgi:hypothetical protein